MRFLPSSLELGLRRLVTQPNYAAAAPTGTSGAPFFAGSTPQGGGAVAFPVLSVFLDVEWTAARDFSLMVQSVGMTSASVFLLTRPGVDRSAYRPLLWWVPTAAFGFVVGMLWLQQVRGIVVQGLFVGFITAFATAYLRSDHRGVRGTATARRPADRVVQAAVAWCGGIAASLFGTGSDILMFTLLVTWFAMRERVATELGIVLMAAISVCGFVFRGLVQQALTEHQIRAWLLAAPVVLLMAPLGAAVLRRISADALLLAVVALNVTQLSWFNLRQPSWERVAWSLLPGAFLFAAFTWLMLRLARRRRREAVACLPVASPCVASLPSSASTLP